MDVLTGELEPWFRRISWSFSIILFRKFARCDLLAAPLLGHPDGQFSITGNRIFTKFGILLYLDTPTTPWGHPCPNADIGLMLPSHVSHSQKFMIQFGAVGNKSNQVMSHGKTSPSESRVNSWTALHISNMKDYKNRNYHTLTDKLRMWGKHRIRLWAPRNPSRSI